MKFITSNEHKYTEVKQVFDLHGLEITHTKMKYVELQADSIEDIAMASAGQLATIISGDFIIEDAGLEIEALNGFPGPYSSYVFGTLGWEGILDLMKETGNRKASFRSVFVLHQDNQFHLFSSTCNGTINFDGIGTHGFGFDPIFVPEGSTKTFAEMSDEEKNTFSHRSKSIIKVINYLKQ
ncbi:MAG: XTP/dITP diphosphatase [Candidatus Heimdallarchaeota archaeon]|nr:XTP/dITP diphosphatase [Candidatus Heimdallarchaeota archaeon]